MNVKVADEVWIATALLHRNHEDREDFTVREIVKQAESERVVGVPLRAGVQIHAYLHCVANKPPNPGRYRMLIETSKGRRRLYRPGDPCHRSRSTGKNLPEEHEIPSAYRNLLDWYRSEYAKDHDQTSTDPILSLRGLGQDVWTDEKADRYVDRLREGWE